MARKLKLANDISAICTQDTHLTAGDTDTQGKHLDSLFCRCCISIQFQGATTGNGIYLRG